MKNHPVIHGLSTCTFSPRHTDLCERYIRGRGIEDDV